MVFHYAVFVGCACHFEIERHCQQEAYRKQNRQYDDCQRQIQIRQISIQALANPIIEKGKFINGNKPLLYRRDKLIVNKYQTNGYGYVRQNAKNEEEYSAKQKHHHNCVYPNMVLHKAFYVDDGNGKACANKYGEQGQQYPRQRELRPKGKPYAPIHTKPHQKRNNEEDIFPQFFQREYENFTQKNFAVIAGECQQHRVFLACKQGEHHTA